jgi:type IV secretion system protein VirB4
MSLWLRGYRKRGKQLASLLHWDSLETPSVVRLRDGGYLSCLTLACPNMASAMQSELVAQAQVLNSALRRFSARWGVQTEIRRRVDCTYTVADWPDWLGACLDAERRDQWAAGSHFTNEVTLSLTYTPLRTVLPGWQRFVYEDLPDEDPERLSLETYDEEQARLVSLLKAAAIGAVAMAEEDLLTYLHGVVSMKAHRVAVPDPACYLNTYLTDMDVYPGVYPRLGHPEEPEAVYLGCVRVHAWPRATHPGLLAVLERLPLEYRVCLRYVPWERRVAIRRAAKRAGQWDSKQRADQRVTDRSALDRADDAQEVWRGLEHGTWSYGVPTVTVVVWDAEVVRLRQKLQAVEHTLQQANLVAKRETLNTMDAWLGTMPGEMYANVTGTPMHSLNLAHLVPATQPWAGARRHPHFDGPALMTVTGPGHTSCALSLHAEDVGHTLCVGPTGSGKSTLVAFLALQFRKYPGAQVYAFDKGQSLRCATHAVGGDWFDLAAVLTDRMQGGGTLDAGTVQPWQSAWRPPYSAWQCFEMEDLLQTPAIVPGVLHGIFATLEARLTGAPTLFVLDEAWVYLDHPMFAARIRDWLKTLRKKNASVLFSTQSLADAAQSSVAAAVNESCMTRIFLANPRALEPQIGALYDAYGLNAREKEVIATMTPKRDYYYQGLTGRQVFDLTLGPKALAITGASRPEDLAAIRAVLATHPNDFAQAWLRQKGLL